MSCEALLSTAAFPLPSKKDMSLSLLPQCTFILKITHNCHPLFLDSFSWLTLCSPWALTFGCLSFLTMVFLAMVWGFILFSINFRVLKWAWRKIIFSDWICRARFFWRRLLSVKICHFPWFDPTLDWTRSFCWWWIRRWRGLWLRIWGFGGIWWWRGLRSWLWWIPC